jgi:hypothetical protein
MLHFGHTSLFLDIKEFEELQPAIKERRKRAIKGEKKLKNLI